MVYQSQSQKKTRKKEEYLKVTLRTYEFVFFFVLYLQIDCISSYYHYVLLSSCRVYFILRICSVLYQFIHRSQYSFSYICTRYSNLCCTPYYNKALILLYNKKVNLYINMIFCIFIPGLVGYKGILIVFKNENYLIQV